MRRFAYVFLLLGVQHAALAAEFFVGAWSTGSSVGLARCSLDDDGKMILRPNSETGYEHYCKFVNKRQLTSNSWNITSTCTGEGMKWRMNSTITVEGNRLVYHTISDGKAGTNTYERCGSPTPGGTSRGGAGRK
jgi:hypothetical protein